jgi:hypothetical protein
MQNKAKIIKQINAQGPKFISMLGGQLIDFDTDKTACTKTSAIQLILYKEGLLPPCLMQS